MHFLDPLVSFITEISSTTWMFLGLFVAASILLLLLLRLRERWRKNRSKLEAEANETSDPPSPQPAAVEAPEETAPAETAVQILPAEKGEIPSKKIQPVRLTLAERFQKGLSKTRAILSADLDKLVAGKRRLDEEMLEELEELMITADIGVQTTMKIIERLTENAPEIENSDSLKELLRSEILALMPPGPVPLPEPRPKPEVIMVVGVNGVGKTTTIGKIAAKYTEEGQKVLIGAADTFRAAAVEQVSIWAERAGADIVKHREGADPAAVAFDSVEAAMARDVDVVLIDTAGRLHTKVNLMEELKKIKRAVSKKLPDAPHQILLVIDATTGQNALKQAEIFHEALGLTGIALTKIDGTARGGIVVGICSTNEVPLRYVGVGETIDDLQPFDPASFVKALF